MSIEAIRTKLRMLEGRLDSSYVWEATIAAIHAMEPSARVETIRWIIPMLRDLYYLTSCSGQIVADEFRNAACALEALLDAHPGRTWFN